MDKFDIQNRLENTAATLQAVAHTLSLIGQEADRYSQHISSSTFLMQDITQQMTDELYKIWEELRGGVNGTTRGKNVANVLTEEKIS